MTWSLRYRIMLLWWKFRNRAHCPHEHIEGIYGDEVWLVGGFRLRCRDCGRYLHGPVTLATTRGPS